MLSKKPSLSLKNYNKISKAFCPTPAAVIDIGTNAIRLLIGCVKEEKVIKLATNRAVTRLGKDILSTGRLNQQSTIKSIKCILDFKETCEKYGAKEIRAVGTSALREAKNSGEFLAQIKEIAGIHIDIISGAKEAELTLTGILSAPNLIRNSSKKIQFLVDIGGGSTEWIIYKKAKGEGQRIIIQKNSELKMGSIPIGAVKLFETFIKHDPPAPDELGRMKSYIKKVCSKSLSLKNISSNLSSLNFIATGGTVATLATIDIGIDEYDEDRVHLHKITLPTLKSIYEKLIMLSAYERTKLKGLEAERADIIIPGTLILLTLMEELRAKTFIVSDYGLLEGALISYHML